MGSQGIRVVHSTPGGFDATEYAYANELKPGTRNGTGLKKGMADVSMNHQPSHSKPPSKGLDRLSPKRKAPDTWNIQPKTKVPPPPKVEKDTEPPVNPNRKELRTKSKAKPAGAEPRAVAHAVPGTLKDPKLEDANANDLKKRNLR